MSTMVGSSATPSVAFKVGCDKKRTKMDHYIDEFHDELQQYILNIKDVTPNGNCGYRTIATLLGQCEESWSLIRQDLIQELQIWHSLYVQLFGLEERPLESINSLYVECGLVPVTKWMTIPNMSYVIVSRYNVVLVHLSRLQSSFHLGVSRQLHPILLQLDLSMEINLYRYTLSTKDTIYFCKLILIYSLTPTFVW